VDSGIITLQCGSVRRWLYAKGAGIMVFVDYTFLQLLNRLQFYFICSAKRPQYIIKEEYK